MAKEQVSDALYIHESWCRGTHPSCACDRLLTPKRGATLAFPDPFRDGIMRCYWGHLTPKTILDEAMKVRLRTGRKVCEIRVGPPIHTPQPWNIGPCVPPTEEAPRVEALRYDPKPDDVIVPTDDGAEYILPALRCLVVKADELPHGSLLLICNPAKGMG